MEKLAQAHVEDLRLDTERRLICIGSALVRFEYLKWNEYINRNPAKRRPDPKRVEHLKKIFREDGCRQLQVDHHIPAVVDQARLDAALADARQNGRWNTNTLPSNYATIKTQDGYPELDFPGGIECRHGLHRIEAGKDWLPWTEKWWIVDLYLSDISYELETLLIEEYANEEKPCDGEIYRKIREYQLLPSKSDSKVSAATCVSLEMRWWARFNPNRKKRLEGLLRNRKLAVGFDALTKIPGLFDAGMMVTTLHTVMATACDEEIQCYLQYTGTAWDGFLKGIRRGLQRVDMVTVKALELRAPGSSTLDAQFLRGKILGGAAFSGFSAQERAVICENVLAFKGVIPSLSTFFQDIHLLEVCVAGIKLVVTVNRDQTLYTALGQLYVSRRQSQLIQTSETTFQSKTASPRDCKKLGYLQLFSFAMRNYTRLSKAAANEGVKEMPRASADPEVIQRLAALATQLGFSSPKIDELARVSSPLPLPVTSTQIPIPILVTTGQGVPIKHRQGLPRANTFKEDKKHLFLHNLCEERDNISEGITSFFVLKSWFTAFFGSLSLAGLVMSTGSANAPTLSDHHQRVGLEDVNMGGSGPETPNQREQVQDLRMKDVDDQIQETIQSVQQRLNWYAKEANRKLEMEQETLSDELFVPRDATATESGNTTTIRFVGREGNENNMLNPSQEYAGQVLELRVDHGDPTSLVAQQVRDYLSMGRRTCDRYKRFIRPEECYSVATRAENQNTLFLIPDVDSRGEAQHCQVLEGETQAIECSGDHGIGQDERQQTQEEDDLDVWDGVMAHEQENAANANILDGNTTIIHLKKIVGDSHDVSKPAKDWVWVDVQSIDVPIDDPHDIIGRRLRRIWQQAHLKPYDKNLRALEFADCYRVAREADDCTLYLMAPSAQTEAEKASECTWIPPPPLPAGVFDLQEKPDRRRFYAPPQAPKETSFKSSTFVAPLNTSPLPSQQEVVKSTAHDRWNPPIPPPFIHQLPLVKSTAEVHRDKIGRGRENKVGMSFQEESKRIRKGKDNMRITQKSTEDHLEEPTQSRKVIKLQSRRVGTTPDSEMVEI